MYKKIFILLLLTIATSTFADEKQSTAHNKIYNFQLEGEEYFSVSDMYSSLGVDHKSIFEFWKDDNITIKVKLVPILAASLRAFYDSEGFYDANYTIDKSETLVKVKVNENKPVRVNDLNISSDYNISKLITFKKDDIFQAKKFINIKSKIIFELDKDGYCSSQLDVKAYVDLVKHTVDLKYDLKKGSICKFGKVTITGNKTIDDNVIKSRIMAKEGKRYSPELVKDTSTELYGLKSFDSVRVNVDRKIYNVIPVDITVSEMKKPYHFEVGVGYDTYVGSRVHTSITKHNFYGNAKEFNLELAWSKLEQLAIINIDKPYLFNIYGYPIGSGVKFGYSNLEFDGFQEEKVFIRSYLDYKGERIKLILGMASEVININALDNLREGEELKFAVNEGSFTLGYPYIDFTYDARDSKLNPKKGFYIRAYTEVGLSDEDSSIYMKSKIEGRLIYSFGDLTLATVIIAGVVDEESENSLPESKYFYAGGSYSNRAYGFNEMGITVSSTEDTIYGASTWANFTFEADYPLVDKLYGAIFTDNTMLNADSYDFNGDVISTIGMGVRYITPIGPFKLDIGMNVNDPSQFGISFQIGQSF